MRKRDPYAELVRRAEYLRHVDEQNDNRSATSTQLNSNELKARIMAAVEQSVDQILREVAGDGTR